MSQNPDFLPEDYTQRREQHRSAILFIGLFIAVMGGIIAAYVVSSGGPRRANAALEVARQQFNEAGKRLDVMKELNGKKQEMMSKAEVSAMLLERVPRSRLLKEFSELMPKGVSLLNLELRSHEAPNKPAVKNDTEDPNKPTEPQRPPEQIVTITIMGVAPTDDQVANFMKALVHSPMLQDVNLLFSEEFKTKDDMVRKFKVEMRISEEADLITPRENSGK